MYMYMYSLIVTVYIMYTGLHYTLYCILHHTINLSLVVLGEWASEGDQATGHGQPGHAPRTAHQQRQAGDLSGSLAQDEKYVCACACVSVVSQLVERSV